MLAGFELEWMVLSTDASGAEQPAVIGGPYGADRLVDGWITPPQCCRLWMRPNSRGCNSIRNLVPVSLNCRSPLARSSRLQIGW
jgi:hypothetical protein